MSRTSLEGEKKMIRKVLILMVSCLLLADFALAQVTDPADLSYKRVRRTKNKSFSADNGCTLLTNDNSQIVSRIIIKGNGSRIALPASENKRSLKVNSISGLEKRYKWWACGEVNSVVGLYARKTANSTPVQVNIEYSDFNDKPDSSGPTCTRTFGNKDGQGNWVWKPHSEGDGNLVVLLPVNQNSRTMKLFSKNGKRLESLRYVGETNGGRSTFRARRHGRNYPSNLYCQYVLNGKKVCRRIPKPGQRYD